MKNTEKELKKEELTIDELEGASGGILSPGSIQKSPIPYTPPVLVESRPDSTIVKPQAKKTGSEIFYPKTKGK